MGTSKGYIPPKNEEWKKAKSAVTRMINGNEGTDSIKKATSKYAEAYLSTHMNTSNIGKVAGKVLQLLGNLKENGINEALNSEGLREVIGRYNGEICTGLINYFCTDNTSIDDGIIRECLVDIFDDKEIFDLDDLNKLNADDFLMYFIIKYMQINFEVAFSEKIQGLCSSIDEANSKIDDVKEYIEDTIRNMYTEDELLNLNWKGTEGINFVNRKCEECYKLLLILEEV
ncbi:hypothetical protein [Clostridium sp. VAP23]|uniref:hypothetical protein n=1 Tax=Clostridium sp. VAP23 TaxID=2949981 RepID=UPI00207A9C83|nr:hypothetical protein [Clostridium sp. VAP23]